MTLFYRPHFIDREYMYPQAVKKNATASINAGFVLVSKNSSEIVLDAKRHRSLKSAVTLCDVHDFIFFLSVTKL